MLGHELRTRGELPTHEAIDLLSQLLSALSAAHALRIVIVMLNLRTCFCKRSLMASQH